MAKNTEVLPYTELVERAREVARVTSDSDRARARGAVNDIYIRKIPSEEDWTFLIISSAITCTAPYNTGVATINTQASAVTFAGGAVIGSSMIGGRIKFNDNADVYYLIDTATISPILSGDQNIASGAFNIFFPVYALAGDFDRFPKNGGLLFSQGGRLTQIPETREQPYYRDYTPSATAVPRACRLVVAGTDGRQYVEVTPPPSKAYNLPYEYLKRPTILAETTGGSATVSASGGTVTFQQGARIAEATTGWFFRIDAFGTGADSEWHRISALNIANSTATIQTAFGLSGATSAAYILCAAPEFPVKVHPAILYGAIAMLTADQNDPLVQVYEQKYREAIDDAKRTFKSRVYSQEVSTIFEEWQYRR